MVKYNDFLDIKILPDALRDNIIDYKEVLSEEERPIIEEQNSSRRIIKDIKGYSSFNEFINQHYTEDYIIYKMNEVVDISIYIKKLLEILVCISKFKNEIQKLESTKELLSDDIEYLYKQNAIAAETIWDLHFFIRKMFTKKIYTFDFLYGFNLLFDRLVLKNFKIQKQENNIQILGASIDSKTYSILKNMKAWQLGNCKIAAPEDNEYKRLSDAKIVKNVLFQKVNDIRSVYAKREFSRFCTSKEFLSNESTKTTFIIPLEYIVFLDIPYSGVIKSESNLFSKDKTKMSNSEIEDTFKEIYDKFCLLEYNLNKEIDDFKQDSKIKYQKIQYSKDIESFLREKKVSKLLLVLDNIKFKEEFMEYLYIKKYTIEKNSKLNYDNDTLSNFAEFVVELQNKYDVTKSACIKCYAQILDKSVDAISKAFNRARKKT